MTSIYETYGLKPVINASGRMTKLGVSTPAAEVVSAVSHAMEHYFEMSDLVDKTGEYIANLLGVEAGVVVACASAGIAQCVAAVIIRDDPHLLVNLHAAQPKGPCEIVLPKGHNVNFGAPVGTMIALGGGKIVEAGWGNECSPAQLEAAITPQTAALLYVKSHHALQKSVLSVEEAVAVAQRNRLPLIVDAAAEEDLQAYYKMGADLVIYSGAKAIEGPTSGLVIGRKQYVEWVKLQSQGIGRAMKVGKEGILGLTCAIERYMKTPAETGISMSERLHPMIEALNNVGGLSARIVWDSAGRDIARGEISIEEKTFGMSATAAVSALKKGDTAIYFREYRMNEGKIEVDVRSVSNAQLAVITQSFEKLAQKK